MLTFERGGCMRTQVRAKEIKKLSKKLRQIEQLKEKKAAGQAMNEAQLTKLAAEAGLRAQLAKLQ